MSSDAYRVCEERGATDDDSLRGWQLEQCGRMRRTCTQPRWIATAVISVSVLAVATLLGQMWLQPPDVHGHGEARVRTLIGPIVLRGGVVQLEQRGSSQVAWLRVVSHSIWTDHHELEAVLSVLRQALRRKRPFLVIWDVRSLTFPRVNMAQVQQVCDAPGARALSNCTRTHRQFAPTPDHCLNQLAPLVPQCGAGARLHLRIRGSLRQARAGARHYPEESVGHCVCPHTATLLPAASALQDC